MNSPLLMLNLLIIIPFLGMIFVLTAKSDRQDCRQNCSNTAIFAIATNIAVIWQIFMSLKKNIAGMQLTEKFHWLKFPDITLVFAVDNVALLMILALHIAVLGALVFIRNEEVPQKALSAFALLFLSTAAGFFISCDIFSFFIFFEGMLLPILMLAGMYGNFKKNVSLSGFFIYNLLGCLVLLVTILYLYNQYGNMTLEEVRTISPKKAMTVYVWGGLLLAFAARIPIWPFHYFTASISAKAHNPLVFVGLTVLPLSGLYGLYRFWPRYIPLEISQYFVWINIVGVVTMLFISLISFSNPDSQYRVFAIATIYEILYLLGIFSQDKAVFANLGYAMFGFLLVMGGLADVSFYVYQKEMRYQSTSQGFLCRAKRLSPIYSFLVFSAVGFPVSAMFTNNFLILSHLLRSNIHIGAVMALAWIIAALALINEMLRLKDDNKDCAFGKNEDLPRSCLVFMAAVIFMLLMSFIRPLWFVIV